MQKTYKSASLISLSTILSAFAPNIAAAQAEPTADEAMEWVSSKVSENFCGKYDGTTTVRLEKMRPGRYRFREFYDGEYGYQVGTIEFELTQIRKVYKDEADGGYEIRIRFENRVKWNINFRSKRGEVEDRNESISGIKFYTCSSQLQNRVEKAVLHARDKAKAAEPF